MTGGAHVLGGDTEFVRGDLKLYTVLPGLGLHRIFAYARVQAQTGDALPQDYLGFSRRDDLQIELPSFVPLAFSGVDRVRGYRAFAVGNRVLFGTMEYRVPLLSDLQTRLLGLVSFGATSLAVFADGGLVWTDGAFDEGAQRLGAGLELKNEVRLAGLFSFGHVIGLAWPVGALATEDAYDLYYRIRAAVPF